MQGKMVVAALLGVLAVSLSSAYAQAAAAATAEAPSTSTEKSARVTLLDKQTNRRQTLVLVAGQVQTVGSLDVRLTKCLPDYAGQLGQDVAWLTITENEKGNGSKTDWFAGWMFNTYPEVSTLDHPRYDAILQGCGTKARKIIQTVGSAPVIETQEPVVDTETAADPYAVPGVPDVSPAPQPAEDTEATAPEAPAADVSAPQPQLEPAAPIAQPVEATPAAPAKPQGQQDLHDLMDSGTY